MFNRTKPNATLPANTIVRNVNDGRAYTWPIDLPVKATIIAEDSEISLFTINGIEYSVNTTDLIWYSER
jgi:hypothetical protein